MALGYLTLILSVKEALGARGLTSGGPVFNYGASQKV